MIKKTTPEMAAAVAAAVDGRIMHQGNGIEVILLKLHPGESIPMHLNPSDVLFAGIKGQAILITSGEELTIGPGETIFVDSTEQRAWKNNGPDDCQVLVIKIQGGH